MLSQKKPNVPIIAGPTGVGKTAIGVHIAIQIEGEIISADSRQVYRYMDIGTAKPTKKERRKVLHHLVGIIDPDKNYSAGRFAKDAESEIKHIFRKGKHPMIVGGSGLYISALKEGLFETPAANDDVKHRIRCEIENTGLESVYKKACSIDPEYASRISPNDRQRIMRLLEVFEITGLTMTEHFRRQRLNKKEKPFDYPLFCLISERKDLYRRINDRVDRMIDEGLLDEVKSLLKKFPDSELNALRSPGYREVIEYLKGSGSFSDTVELIKRNSRRFAKRQLTWFRKMKNIKWYNIDIKNEKEKLIDEILYLIKENSIL